MPYKFLILLILCFSLIWPFKEYLFDLGHAWYFGFPLPTYQLTVDKNQLISMSDGIQLATDIYRPNNSGTYPTIVARTPYNKQNPEHYYTQIARLFAGQGFAFVVQDVRGKFASDGKFYPHKYEIDDGRQTLTWIKAQPWSDGQVALFGFSYLGQCAWQATEQTLEDVCTIVPWFTGSHLYSLWYDKNVLLLKQLAIWMCQYSQREEIKIDQQKMTEALRFSPDGSEIDTKFTGKSILAYRDFLSHSKDGPFWRELATPVNELKQDIPVLLGSGWYDQFLTAAIEDFKTLRLAPISSKRYESRLVIGPWMHQPTQKINALDLKKGAHFFYQLPIMLKWYQRWMGDYVSSDLAPVTYYLMGKNQWQTAQDWPPPEAKPLKFYLNVNDQQTQPHTLSSSGKSQLNFFPSIGGRELYSKAKEDILNQNFLSSREDIIFWSSLPLTQALSIVGSPRLSLYISQAPSSFDLSVKLIDVFPDGNLQLITDGYIRIEQAQDIDIYPIEISFADTAYTLFPHHCLKLAITHSDFPAHAPNLNLNPAKDISLHFLNDSNHPSLLEILELPNL